MAYKKRKRSTTRGKKRSSRVSRRPRRGKVSRTRRTRRRNSGQTVRLVIEQAPVQSSMNIEGRPKRRAMF